MRNLTIRFILMATLGVFSALLFASAAIGMYSLQGADRALARGQLLAMTTTEINDVYKDASRTRSSLARAYADAKENGKPLSASEHLATAAKYDESMRATLARFRHRPPLEGMEPAVQNDLVAAADRLSASLDMAFVAQRADDIPGYTAINLDKLTPEGGSFSRLLEDFQKRSTALSQELLAQRESDYAMVKLLVGAGVLFSLLLVVAMHRFLKRAVLEPLERAIALLDRVAGGDLSAAVHGSSQTEIGRLLDGIERMQSSLISIVRDVRCGADLIGVAAHESASGNADLSSRTENQATALQETAASMEELTTTVRQTADHALQARELARGASGTALAGGDAMARMVDTMQGIADASRKIVDIIGVIDGIAFQTNVLALNAAVEAARAGEHGRGFAVVASEVRNLAQRSALAAKEVKQLIDDSVGRVASGSALVQQARTTMGQVVDSVHSVAGIVDGIAQASKEQSAGIAQVSEALTQMDDVTQRNAALVEQAAAAASAMDEETRRLIDIVGRFRLAA